MPKRKQNPGGKSPFSIRLASLRKEKGMNMETLAKNVGVSKSYISLLESGGRQPSRDVVIQLASAIGDRESDALRDELLILAGFAPINTRAIAAYQDALTIYEQALAENPDDIRVYSRLILALIKAERQSVAQERIQQGLQKFTDVVQLQSLLAYLELSKGHFEAALLNQETALRQYDLQPRGALGRSDLVFNYGSIHFMQGYAALGRYIQDQHEHERDQALKSFNAARELFEQALVESSDDPYMLDELARLCFNLAYLQRTPEAWQDTIVHYRRLMTSPLKYSLASQQLMESAAFLAHAYTQNGEYDQAQLTLGLLSAFKPEFWLVHYLEACMYSQRSGTYPTDRDADVKSDLDLALAALERALAHDSHDQARAEAEHDPDLKALRSQRKAEFAKLLKKENFHP